MESGSTKDFALLAVGIVAGLAPWLLDKGGIEVPKPVTMLVGIAAALAFWWGAYNLIFASCPLEWRRPRVSVAGLAFVALAILTILTILWLSSGIFRWNRQDLTKLPEDLERISG